MNKRKKAKVEKGSCVACGVCMNACPRTAVTIWKGCYAVVDTESCIGCGICERSCPVGAISVEVVSDEEEK